MTRRPSAAIERQLASAAYGLCGISGISLLDPSGESLRSRGLTVPVTARPPTSSRDPEAASVNGSTSRGRSTRDQAGAVVTGVDMNPAEASSTAPSAAGTSARTPPGRGHLNTGPDIVPAMRSDITSAGAAGETPTPARGYAPVMGITTGRSDYRTLVPTMCSFPVFPGIP